MSENDSESVGSDHTNTRTSQGYDELTRKHTKVTYRTRANNLPV